jgi:hypothetical protein
MTRRNHQQHHQVLVARSTRADCARGSKEETMGRYACLAALIVVLLAAVIANQFTHTPMLLQNPVIVLPSNSEEAQRSRQLDREWERNIHAREERFRIVNELEQETIAFDEAIELFRPLNECDPIVLATLRKRHPDRSDEEILGYQVIVAVHGQPRRDEDRRIAFLRNLIAQQRDRFGEQALVPTLALNAISKERER